MQLINNVKDKNENFQLRNANEEENLIYCKLSERSDRYRINRQIARLELQVNR